MKPNTLDQAVVNLMLPRLEDELNAFYFYRAASNWCQGVGFFKAGEFFANESNDELEHAKKIEKYLVDWNVDPALPSIPKPPIKFTGLLDVIEKAYRIEYELYEAYEDTSMALFNMDLCVFDFFQEFRTLQKNAVAEYSDKLNMLEGVTPAGKLEMLLLEKKLF
jgi:ferritin